MNVVDLFDKDGRTTVEAAVSADAHVRHDARVQAIERLFEMPSIVKLFEYKGVRSYEVHLIRYIVSCEWCQFDAVTALDGRAVCQDDARSFFVYRLAQYLSLPRTTLDGIADEYRRSQEIGRSLVQEKYARMMEKTDYSRWRRDWSVRLEAPSPVKRELLAEIERLLDTCMADVRVRYPEVQRHARIAHSTRGVISAIDYFLAEVASYRLETLQVLLDGLRAMWNAHINFIEAIYDNTVLIAQAIEG